MEDTWERRGLGLLVLRIALGLIFFLHGWMKLVAGEESFLREMLAMVGWSAPGVLVWTIAALELLCGAALILGALTRVAALALAVEMVVAVSLFHVRQGFFIVAVPNVPLAYGFEYHLALVGGLLCLALAGPGPFTAAGGRRRFANRGTSDPAREP